MQFPDKFLWGAATSSYQIEGASREDGKGESIWDRFCRQPGTIAHGENGDTACDHFHRYLDDVGIMRRLGLKAYRFSIAWPRVLPAGRGPANAAGLDFYDRLVDAQLDAGIEPFATLHHWDLPQALQETGGWAARATGQAFAEFAELMATHLGDRVRFWVTINEPRVIMTEGYLRGTHAPGKQEPATAGLVGHHLLLAHGLALQALRAASPGVQAGIALNLSGVDPATDSVEDQAAAERAWSMEEAPFLDALFRAEIPPRGWRALGDQRSAVQAGDPAVITQPLDFLGLNFYSRRRVRAAGDVGPAPGAPTTEMGWEVHPPSLRAVLNRIQRDYRLPPVYVTENGAAFRDELSPDGTVHDPRRVDYLRQHIGQIWLAMQDGLDIRGYFVWSLLDNFEWTYGYAKRFGIVRVDFETQQRTLKQSAVWYQRLISSGCLDLAEA
jgi:beta-glucosidase